jgi:hypothetical protein
MNNFDRILLVAYRSPVSGVSTIYAAGSPQTTIADVLDTGSARRLAAAWNVCDGIDTAMLEATETGGVPALLRECEYGRRELVGLLTEAERFISGFEDDPSQAGIPELLARMRVHTGSSADGEWSGSPDPTDPDNFWIDDETGERVSAETGERTAPPSTAWMAGVSRADMRAMYGTPGEDE